MAKRAPCIVMAGGALCGRPVSFMDATPFITPLAWWQAADPSGVQTCHECLSVVRNAVEESERRNIERGRP